MIQVLIIFPDASALIVHGIDGGKAPAIASKLKLAWSPEAAAYAVSEAIELGVALYVTARERPKGEPWWTIINPAHVVAVNAPQGA